jgi:hypothetical protein
MRKFYFLTAIASLLMLNCFAQGTVKGKLFDSSGKLPLALATISVFKAADTSLVSYRLSNPEGDFRVPGLPANTELRMIISFTGFLPFRQLITLKNNAVMDVGKILLTPSSKSLEEVLVIAERPPVVVRKDTIEFNASSFRTLPTALLEDLLKKLPGVEVDPDGNITANGKKVNRILIDGKSFFGDDPKIASRNLPANVIEKVQVTADKDEINRDVTGDLTNVGQVINLTLKKGVKKGWFGKAYAGGGTSDRYEAGGIANIYRDTLQLSLLAFSNNVGKSGFSFKEVQDLGGFNRSGANSMMIMNRGGQTGFAINGISFGGTDAGIARTSGAGFNLNHAPNKNRSFFLQYFFGNTRNNIISSSNLKQFLGDTTVETNTNTNNNRTAFTHNFSTGTKIKIDSLTDFEFRASYGYSNTIENINAAISVSDNYLGKKSNGNGIQYNTNDAYRYNHNLFITRKPRNKKGGAWNLNNSITANKNLLDNITESNNEYFIPSYYKRPFNQLRKQNTPYISSFTNLGYSKPLSSKFSFRWNNRHEYLHDRQDIGTYNKDLLTSKYELINYSQSSGLERTQNRFMSYAGISYKIKKFTFSSGIAGLWQHIENRFLNVTDPLGTRLFNLLPSASFQWKQLSANYNYNVNPPSINYLTPVPDSSNPFMIRYGNPYLQPSRQHNFYISNYSFLQQSGTTLNMYFNASLTDNDVVMSRTIEKNGVQTDRPVNANGSASIYGSIGYGKEYKNKQKFIFSFRVSPYVNLNKRKLIVNNIASTGTTYNIGPNINVGLNWNDIIEYRPMYNPGFSKTVYSDKTFNEISSTTQYMENEVIVRLPKKLVWESNVTYRYISNTPAGIPNNTVLWNAAVTYLMFKGDKGLLKLSVFDILNRNNGASQYVSTNQVINQQTNVLKRFAELSFTYNIRNMGAPRKIGGRDRLFMF